MFNKIIKHLKQGTLLKTLLKRFVGVVLLRILSQHHLYNALMYKLQFGFSKSIKNPETFSQKIYYLRDQYKGNALATMVSDKIAVREYVTASIGGEVLNNLLFITDDPSNIDYDTLPDRFVIKTNQACGTNIIVKDKSSIDKHETYQKLTKWLKMNYADSYGEMQYYNIKPQILIEEYLEDEGDEFLIDYKFWCFNGNCKFLVVHDRFSIADEILHNKLSFDLNFKPITVFKNQTENNNKFKIPISLNLMTDYASILSREFAFVRVDFYEVNGEPVFGEMTLTPTGGNNHYLSDDAQLQLGKEVDIKLMNSVGISYE